MSNAAPSPSTPEAQKKSPWGLVVFTILVFVSACVVIGVISAQKEDDYAVEDECVRLVAEWAGVDPGEIASKSVGTSRVALDYRGAYPGGEWACGGERGVKDPYEVMVFPGGMDGDAVPEQIHSNPAP